jgi:hypothetical protein
MTSLGPRAEGRTVDRVPIPISAEVDLDALMLRVREAASANTAGGGTLHTPTVADDGAREPDLIRVLEAQADWNEHARQAFEALADGIRALRDDWVGAQAELRREITRLSGQLEQLRAGTRAHRAAASSRGASKSRPAGKRRPRR